MKRLIRPVLGSIVLIAFLIFAWAYLGYWQFMRAPMNLPKDGITFVVEGGDGLDKIAARLQSMDVIERRLWFRIYGRLHKNVTFKIGEYQLRSQLTPLELLNKLEQGDVISYRFTIVEGFTARQVIEALNGTKGLKPVTDSELEKLSAEYLAGKPLEGWLFPETYSWVKGDKGINILSRAIVAMKDKLNSLWSARDPTLPYASAYEALIMASIVEKETGIASERAQIAGVFVRRLQKRMRLQTDPTVIYGLGSAFDGNLTRRHLKQATPYNTYVIKGLPPTPIANPGGAALEAAFAPAEGNSLYFVATGNGGHYFSDTLEQHLKAVRKYQLKKR